MFDLLGQAVAAGRTEVGTMKLPDKTVWRTGAAMQLLLL
jgi:hypothetical protein